MYTYFKRVVHHTHIYSFQLKNKQKIKKIQDSIQHLKNMAPGTCYIGTDLMNLCYRFYQFPFPPNLFHSHLCLLGDAD